jgi:hypothetical protein
MFPCANYNYSAAENAVRSGKKTVMPKDVFEAMAELEYGFMLPRLEAEVSKFTSIQADKRNTYRKKVREEKKAVTGTATTSTPAGPMNGDVTMERADDGERATKRVRRESGDAEDVTEEEGDETVDVDDEEVEDDEIEEEVAEEGLTEDPLEEKSTKTDDDTDDANQSD